MLHGHLLTFSFLETKSYIFCSALDSALRYLSTKQGNPTWTTDYLQWVQSTGEGFELPTRTENGLYSLTCLCLLQLATMGSISTLTERHVQEQTIGVLFSPSSIAFGVPFNKGHTLGKEMGCFNDNCSWDVQPNAQQTSSKLKVWADTIAISDLCCDFNNCCWAVEICKFISSMYNGYVFKPIH